MSKNGQDSRIYSGLYINCLVSTTTTEEQIKTTGDRSLSSANWQKQDRWMMSSVGNNGLQGPLVRMQADVALGRRFHRTYLS